ncbi:MAG TPA: hypothetical protein VH560_00370 [Polyangia bacterium]|nr:hypothetical protein [Polyangia bacterium]
MRVDNLLPRIGRLAFAAALASASACGPSVDEVPSCTPGASSACTCTDGAPGAQLCEEDGKHLDACECGSGAGGAGGAGTTTTQASTVSTGGATSVTGAGAGTASTAATGGGGAASTGSVGGSTSASTGGHQGGSGGGVTSFLPSDVSGLVLWLDASDAGTVTTNGTSVLSVTDRSQTARVLTAGNGPKYVIGGQNGLNTIDFNSASNTQYLLASGNITVQTWIFAAKFDAGMQLCHGGYYYDLRPGNSGAQPWLYGYDCDNGFTALSDARANNTVVPTNASFADSLWQTSLFEIGATATSTTLTLFNWYQLAEGARVSFGEVAVYDRALSDAEKTELYGYLHAKWE